MADVRAKATIDAQWRGGNETREAARDIGGLDDNAKDATAGFGNLTKGVGLAVAGFAAAAGAAAVLGRGLIEVTTLAAEQQRVEAQLAATLESTGHAAGLSALQLKDMASELQNVTTFGDEAIIASQSLLLTFTQIGGDVFPRAQAAILDTATAMGTDLKSATLQVGKALNDPIKGVAALAESGIQFSESQKTMIASLVKTGDTAAAQTIILKELETQFGGSAAAAAQTAQGAFTQFQNIVGDVGEAIGAQLLPGLTEIANEAGPAVLAAMQELSPEIDSIGDGMSAAADAIVPLLQNMTQIVKTARDVNRAVKAIVTVGLSELIPWIKGATDAWRDNNAEMLRVQTNARRARMGLDPIVDTDLEGWANDGAQGIEQVNGAFGDLSTSADDLTTAVDANAMSLFNQAGAMDRLAARAGTHVPPALDELFNAEVVVMDAVESTTEAMVRQDGAGVNLAGTFERVSSSISGQFLDALDMTDGKLTSLQQATADMPAFLLQMGMEAGATGAELGILASATGDFTQAQIDSMVQTTIFETRLGELKSRFADGKLSVEGFTMAVQGLFDGITALQDKTVTVTVNTVQNGQTVTNNTSGGAGLQEFSDGQAPGRAIGGYVGANQTVTVGERGPELFTPVNAGFIRDNETSFGNRGGNSGPRVVNHNTFVGMEATALFSNSLEMDAELTTVIG